jgi:cyclomaltodextrinase
VSTTEVTRPDWVRDAVFYQIFPERFARSAAASTDVEAWDAKPTRDNFLGGDLRGITEHLDHLVDLAVNAIYLTPIFAAGTNHRYDTEDYTRIDPRLGDDAAFDAFLDAAHERGIHVVLDAVFHHCGAGHWAFQDVKQNGLDSPYVDWFFITEHPLVTDPAPNYGTCSGCWYLPKLNVDNPGLREHLFDAVRAWTGRGIDGWRLDVPYMMENPAFWAEFRGVVRDINPDAYIVAEAWDDAGEWATGKSSDAAMNYPLRDALLAFLVDRRSGAGSLAARIAEIDLDVGVEATGHMLNLLASHDTARLRTTCGGERDLTMLATAMLLSLRGAPMLYYGDEVGLVGFNDPECRGAMPWDESAWDHELHAHVRELAHLRRDSVALRRGDQSVAAVTDDVVRIVRTHTNQVVTVLANRSDVDVVIDLAAAGRDLLTNAAVAAGPLTLPGRGVVFVEQAGT